MTSLPQAKRFDWRNLALRIASAAVLIPAVVVAAFIDVSWPYLTLIAVGVTMLSIEWGGMSAPRSPMRVSAAVTVAVLVVTVLAHQLAHQLAHPHAHWHGV